MRGSCVGKVGEASVGPTRSPTSKRVMLPIRTLRLGSMWQVGIKVSMSRLLTMHIRGNLMHSAKQLNA